MTSDKGVVERLTKTQREVLEAVSQAEYGVGSLNLSGRARLPIPVHG